MGNKEVVIYTSPICVDCQSAKKFLIEEGVKFEEKSIENPKNKEELVKPKKCICIFSASQRLINTKIFTESEETFLVKTKCC